jgi:hypothetical protein
MSTGEALNLRNKCDWAFARFVTVHGVSKEDRITFDDAGRRIELVENYVDPPYPGSGNGWAPSG